jgi:DNA-binding ferritin-like protein (Dps family)
MSFTKFFNTYLNPVKIYQAKREYRQQMARVKALPKDYQFVYEKITKYMWSWGGGDGLDLLQTQYDLIELFEEAAAEKRPVLEITGPDVAAFSDALVRNSGAKLWTEQWAKNLNRDINRKLKNS